MIFFFLFSIVSKLLNFQILEIYVDWKSGSGSKSLAYSNWAAGSGSEQLTYNNWASGSGSKFLTWNLICYIINELICLAISLYLLSSYFTLSIVNSPSSNHGLHQALKALQLPGPDPDTIKVCYPQLHPWKWTIIFV